jgi:hypothetical protein
MTCDLSDSNPIFALGLEANSYMVVFDSPNPGKRAALVLKSSSVELSRFPVLLCPRGCQMRLGLATAPVLTPLAPVAPSSTSPSLPTFSPLPPLRLFTLPPGSASSSSFFFLFPNCVSEEPGIRDTTS